MSAAAQEQDGTNILDCWRLEFSLHEARERVRRDLEAYWTWRDTNTLPPDYEPGPTPLVRVLMATDAGWPRSGGGLNIGLPIPDLALAYDVKLQEILNRIGKGKWHLLWLFYSPLSPVAFEAKPYELIEKLEHLGKGKAKDFIKWSVRKIAEIMYPGGYPVAVRIDDEEEAE